MININFFDDSVLLDKVIVAHRRKIHQLAELSFEEKQTTAYIVDALKKMGITVQTFPDYYGAIATITGDQNGKTVMLRADIDALPMSENSGDSFAATNGCMHACGHDCHAAMLLGAAQLLISQKTHLAGTVKLLFQSGEEAFIGSRYYAEKGHLDEVDALFGMHVWGHLAAPLVNIEDGDRMAACDNFKIIVNGHGSHGSTPHLAHDAIMAASAIILNLQSFASRRNDPLNPLVLTVGTIKSGSQFNIIAPTAEMEGTIRTFSSDVRKTIETELQRIITHTAQALGCSATFILDRIEGPVCNEHLALNDIARKAAIKLFGSENLVAMPKVMGSEDFSHLMEKKPGLFAFLGCLNEEKGIIYPNHSDKFRIDERILHRGAALYAQFAYDYLKHGEAA